MFAELYETEESEKVNFEIEDELKQQWVIDKLYRHLSSKSSLLEIGSGTGKDLEFLSRYYTVTGSDISPAVLSTLEKNLPTIPVVELNAIDIQTEMRFHCLFSNKVLPKLTTDELATSVLNQLPRLEPYGLVCHTFWKGSGEKQISGKTVQQYTGQEIISMFAPHFGVLELQTYTDVEQDDSIMLISEKLY